MKTLPGFFSGSQRPGGGFFLPIVPQINPQNKDWCVGPGCQP